jgi:RNA-binding protein
MKLTNPQTRYLKSLAHSLKPVVTVGMKGLSQSIQDETDSALSRHELIKIKLPAVPKQQKIEMIDKITRQSGSLSITLTGRTVILFRQNLPQKSKITLPGQGPS